METAVENVPVQFTPSAMQELQRLYLDAQHSDDNMLRVGVKGGGCSGMTYVLGFAAAEPDDQIFDVQGIPMLLKKSHALYLAGISIDWQNGLNNRGFIFSNPNASSTCGCGTSFSV
jgi:iron-sulfur cluster assembly protein